MNRSAAAPPAPDDRPTAAAPRVVTRDLTRRFGARQALAGVSLRVGHGEIVGLLGPNGSGKTTLLRVLAGLLRAGSGTARVLDRDPWRQRAALLGAARFAFSPPRLFESLTAVETLEHLLSFHPAAVRRNARRQVDRVLEQVGLAERARDRVRTYSFGMRQRLMVAQALLPVPQVLVLDEPTDGLDPVAVLELRDLLKALRHDHGTSILLSSHLLAEIEHLVDRIVVLGEGRVLYDGSPHALLARHARTRLVVDRVPEARRVLEQHGFAVDAGADGALDVEDGELDLETAHGWMQEAGVRLLAFHPHRPTLEQAVSTFFRNPAHGSSRA